MRTVKNKEVSPVVVHFCDLSNLKAEAGLLKVQGQFDLENKTGTRVEGKWVWWCLPVIPARAVGGKRVGNSRSSSVVKPRANEKLYS